MTISKTFLSAAQDLLGPKGWSMDAGALRDVSTPWRGAHQGATPFLALPAATEEVAALVRLCAEHAVPITPQGGNTGLVDGGVPHGEVTLSLRRMQAVRDVDAFNNSMTIEAGAPLVAAQDAATAADRFFPLSLGSEGTATIGGLISTNAGGVAVLRYGMIRDLLLGLEVVLPSGEVWNGLSGLRKNNTGYDLKHLFAGAEGTLGVITAASLKLFPQTRQASAWIACDTPQQMVELFQDIRSTVGDTVTSFEMIPRRAVEIVMADAPGTRDPLPSGADWRVLLEISMADDAQSRAALESALMNALEKGLASDAVIAESLQHAKDFWQIRETISLSLRAYGEIANHDIAVPVSAIPAFFPACAAALETIVPGAEIVAFGHVGDGNIHYAVAEAAGAEVKQLRSHAAEITQTVHRQALAHGGSISAEHGVGRMKRDELMSVRDPVATAAMRAIKRALDPQNIMNPGRVLPVQSSD